MQRDQNNPPRNGQRIKITWLPKNNAWPESNCYIGMFGAVEQSDENGFVLRSSGGVILIVDEKYRYVDMDEELSRIRRNRRFSMRLAGAMFG